MTYFEVDCSINAHLLCPFHGGEDKLSDSVHITALSLDQVEMVAHSKAALQEERRTAAEQTALGQDGNAVTKEVSLIPVRWWAGQGEEGVEQGGGVGREREEWSREEGWGRERE